MTNQIKNFIEEEKRIEEEFIEILEYGKDLTNEEVWTDLEKIQWLRKSMKSYKISLIKMIVDGTREKIQEDLDAGGFYKICSNETTFKNYVMGVLSELTDGK